MIRSLHRFFGWHHWTLTKYEAVYRDYYVDDFTKYVRQCSICGTKAVRFNGITRRLDHKLDMKGFNGKSLYYQNTTWNMEPKLLLCNEETIRQIHET